MEAGVWDFKRQGGNSQADEEEQTCGKQMLAGPNGPQRGCAGSSCPPLSSYRAEVTALFLWQVFYPIPLVR